MSLHHEILAQQLRQLYGRDWRPNHAIPQTRRNRRHCLDPDERHSGGQEPQHCRSSRASHQPAVDSNHVVPLLHIWLRLHSLTPHSTTSGQLRNVYRLRLEQRPLLQNLRQIVSVHWKRLCRRAFPVSEVADNTRHPMKRNPARVVQSQRENWIQYLVQIFTSISKSLEQALVPAGRKFTYENTSAAMELLDIRIISEQLNSLLIDYMVNNDVYLMDQSQTTLGVLD
ncbi:uncharacterized protein LOC115763725 isoform X1 [Drosophila novamexicana]|uniref:uncharacterized protein LOC115763725 isoform X1 n=1 Tax=Drosophila novamexicana TaxID=47314 RepID=UPI0011E606EC|nr:uncharacterized protein LOC115763725 isoform X1 [Drosophila novamexicana]